jgi:phosphoribosyl-ATP pyrophosphohydrolase
MGQPDIKKLDVLNELARTINARKHAGAETSYTASLLNKGIDACAKKFGEEAIELILAATSKDATHTTAEAADVIYHFVVLLEATGVSLDDVMAELARRQGTSGHAEKALRDQDLRGQD